MVLVLTAIGLLLVMAASAAAALIQGSRRHVFDGAHAHDVVRRLDEVNQRLARVEAAPTPARRGGSSDAIS